MVNANVDPDEIVGGIIDRYHKRKLHQVVTESCTCGNALFISPQQIPPAGNSSIIIFAQNDSQMSFELLSLFDEGYYFEPKDVQCTRSLHQSRLHDAKELLISNVLINNPSVYDINRVISDMGIALNMQVDKNYLIYNQRSVPDNINQKLEILGLNNSNSKLYKKYTNLNKYYNATKHAKQEENRRIQSILTTADGQLIAIDFFETVKRIFRWYYNKYSGSVPDWEELKPIKYSSYRISYRFLYSRVWL